MVNLHFRDGETMSYTTRKAMIQKLQRCEKAQHFLVGMLTEIGTTYQEVAPEVSHTVATMIGTYEALIEVFHYIKEEIIDL